jgi:hypothetical protein
MENRAAVFTSQPQAVEVYQAGAWWAGELLGWRHDSNGSCQVWVRVVLGGVEETAWTDLTTLRLPERHLTVAQPAAAYAPATQEMSVARHPSGRRARSADTDPQATAGLPLVRDLAAVPDLPSTGGRRTADETAQFASVGRRRAPEATKSPSGGRRRAPETGESPSVGRRRAPESVAAVAAAPSVAAPSVAAPSVAAPSVAAPSAVAPSAVAPSAVAPSAAARGAAPGVAGRHRATGAPGAPGDPGRHRTADTGLLPVVSDTAEPRSDVRSQQPAPRGPRSAPPVHRPRPEGAYERVREGWTAPAGMEPELLTRPMRLSDHAPHARRPRVDGSVAGV